MLLACSRKQQVIEPVKHVPPIHLTEVQEIQSFDGDTNGDFFLYSQGLLDELARCHINLQAIRKWMEMSL